MSYAMRMVLLAVFDAVIVSISFLIANYLRFEGDIPYQYTKEIPFVLPLTIGIHFISLYFFKLYRKVWLYASVGELISIIKALVIGSVAFYVVNVLVVHLDVPRSIYLISMMVSILLIGGSRFVWRLYNDNYMKKQPHQRRALIIGAGGSGSFVVKQLKHQRDAEFYPIGFIDDDPKKQRLEVLGVPVLGTRKEIAQVIRNYEIDDIVLAIPSAPKSEVAKIIDICKKTGARLRILPRVQDLIDGKISIQRIRDVDVEDLLGREPIKVDLEGIANYVEDKVVLVTGAGGSIGSELCRQVARFKPRQILLLGHGENSIYNIELELKKNFPDLAIEPLIAEIQDRDRIDDVFNQYRPNVVFHAAAHKHVP
ncbi:MAG TPA: polysaccharide biosynthesis protein, partial [Paenibacillaceae bacterium]|nr:polysaccharide biosynthesis protein [Paenibacillaceae bacterium]